MWILIALGATLINSLENVLQKKSMLHFNVYVLTWVILATPSIFYVPALIHMGLPNHVGPQFWPSVIARVIVNSIGLVLFFKALQLTQFSLAIPMSAFRSIFVLFASLIINHLFPSPMGVAGVLVIVVGVYLLHFDRHSKRLLSPFQNIARDKGVLLMLLNGPLTGIAIALLRVGIDNSNTTFYTLFFQPFWALCFLPVAILMGRKQFLQVFSLRSVKRLVPIGLLDSANLLLQNVAYSLTLPVYVAAIQSTSILFGALFGFYFFGEKLTGKVFSALIIVGGVALIALS